jgi:hypothetical protein
MVPTVFELPCPTRTTRRCHSHPSLTAAFMLWLAP